MQEDLNKIYLMLGQIEAGIEGINHRLERINGSVAKNTQWRFYMTGAIGVLGVVIGYLIKII